MKEINEKEMEKATGGGDWNSFLDMLREKSAATLREKGYTIVTDQRRGMNCEDFFDYSLKKGWCGVCQWHVESLDTFECFCTKGH